MRYPIALMMVLLLVCASAAGAQQTVTLPLSEFTPVGTVTLKCVESEYNISVPVPERWDINGVRLKLKWQSSISLIPRQSQMVVRWGGVVINQIPLFSTSGAMSVEIDVPVRLLKPGYNNLNIFVAQHHKDQCENFCAPEIWTSLNLTDSEIEVDYNMKPAPLELSELHEFVFDPRLFTDEHVHIVMENNSREVMTSAGIVASGVARRYDYRKVTFSVSQDLMPGRDNVIVGTSKFVQSTLTRWGLQPRDTAAPTIRMYHMPAVPVGTDKTRVLFVVAGSNTDNLALAAETFANLTFPYPGSDEIVAHSFEVADIALYGGRQVIKADHEYDFKTLNFDTYSFRGLNPPSRALSFRLPADFLIKHNRAATLVVAFTYGAGLKPESALNLMVNGKHVRAIHLENKDGEFIEKYTISLPSYLFKPGANTIEFQPILAGVLKECDIVQSGNMFLTIFDSSTLKFPDMPHFVQLPSLELFMLNGFPMTRWPDGHESMVYLPKPDNDNVAAALNVISLITQRNGYPLFGIIVSGEVPAGWNGEMFVVGKVSDLPPDLLKSAPIAPGKDSTVNYPVVASWDEEVAYAVSKQTSKLGPRSGLFMQFQSPDVKGRSVFVMTAETPESLKAMSVAMLTPEAQADAKGSLLLMEVVNGKKPKTHSVNVGKKYFVGKEGVASGFSILINTYPIIYYILIVLAVAALGALVAFILIRRRKAKADAKRA